MLDVSFHQLMVNSAERSELRYVFFRAIAAFYQVDASTHSELTSAGCHYLIVCHNNETCFPKTFFADKLYLLGTVRHVLPKK